MSRICCAHPQRIDSPEPPARAPMSIDGIFAAAALPEDHPHALRLPHKKPELVSGIVRSPGIAAKLKSQINRKSIKALRSSDDYDKDNLAITSTEIVDQILPCPQGERDGKMLPIDSMILRKRQSHPRFGSVRTLTPVGKETYTDVRPSMARSLEWFKPLLHKPSDVQSSPVPVTKIFPKPGPDDGPDGENSARQTPGVPQSVSSPNLLNRPFKEPVTPLRRTKSFFDLGLLKVHKTRTNTDFAAAADGMPTAADIQSVPREQDGVQADTLGGAAPTSDEGATTVSPMSKLGSAIHLHTMDISQQLRSMSAMSSEPDDEDSHSLITPMGDVWTFHRRDRSGFRSTSSGLALKSLSTANEALAPPARVRSPAAASSVYSRPSSMNSDEDITPAPYEVQQTASNWPLKPRPSAMELDGNAEDVAPHEALQLDDGGELDEQPQMRMDTQQSLSPQLAHCNLDTPNALSPKHKDEADPSTPRLTVVEEPSTISYATSSSVHFVSPHVEASSIQTKNSTSTLDTTNSKRSKFFERFSPPKKAVRKRRSIFKFLRPGSKKQTNVRSISSPVLRTQPSYDGTGDEPGEGLLTVQYELTNSPKHGQRSASATYLDAGRRGTLSVTGPRNILTDLSAGDSSGRRGTGTHLAVPGNAPPQRRVSVADYQRNLTVTGDNRRRPSAVNLTRLVEVQEDDRSSSHGLRSKLSRAKSIHEDRPTGVMAQAMERHLQEKSLFRSASKQRESLGQHQSDAQPIFRTDTLLATSSSATEKQNDLLDPTTRFGRWTSSSLYPPGESSAEGSPKFVTAANSLHTPSMQTTHATGPGLHEASRIGTGLQSWARYPSHTRPERCGSAGPPDKILTRDFAASTSTTTHAPTTALQNPEGKPKHLKARRSTTFSGLTRYYSNIFSSTSTAKNRRSSIAAGGWLQNPDLELLPPASSHEVHHDHGFKQHLHQLEHDLEAAVRKDVEWVEGEAQKLEKAIEKDVEIVEDQADRLVGIQPHHLLERGQEQEVLGGNVAAPSPFHEGSPFQAGLSAAAAGERHRASSFLGPWDEGGAEHDEEEEAEEVQGPLVSVTGPDEAGGPGRDTALDGTSDALQPRRQSPAAEQSRTPSSKAEQWSQLYQSCLQPSAPPASVLKPVKPRSPEQDKRKMLDPKASIRRFPSVTVVDDRKGHERSVSLISVRVSERGSLERGSLRSALSGDGMLRESTRDLLGLIERREREERERLLGCAV
ncbi:hypothetical protein Tdes44962_MAKER05537 [Teratosphaeria destructans]|uniref:Uncharacterized protein n=1 Tax=Teratosphaeria destructans TaxID=418781 RepID=A0A9W7VYS4_9PEZI|nr:hypothetical protein Tdes44962_MAKER05537 [Teratosphaeria destructans]